MRQTIGRLSIYSPDTFGIASALYELGGMTVLHDASGCNSTYTTHDEPRWYDIDSMVYISAISEMEAVMGDDRKLIDDMVRTSSELHPAFTAIAGTPIPMMTGFDFKAVASVIEKKTGVPSFGFATNGMEDYLAGVSMAFKAFAERMTLPAEKVKGGVNLLGLTPLDFPLDVPEKLRAWLEGNGFTVLSSWAMGSSLADIREKTAAAEVNLVLSWDGLAAAEVLRRKYGTPYVVGIPMGKFADLVLRALKQSISDGENRNAFPPCAAGSRKIIIGESVSALSLAAALSAAGEEYTAVCPLRGVSGQNVRFAGSEDLLQKALENAETVIADPLFAPVLPEGSALIRLPHTAYSGRLYEREMSADIQKIVQMISVQ